MLRSSLILPAALALLAPIATADQWDKKTILTVNEAILVPGATLEPGKYVVKLVESAADRHIVQITNEREDHVYTTFLAIPNYRLKPTANTAFQWWETPSGNPPAMRAWFYPGDNFGQEFAYPKGLSARIARAAHQPVPTVATETPAELKTAPLTATAPTGEEQPFMPPAMTPRPELPLLAQAPPAPAPAAVEPAAPAAAPVTPAPVQELPRTASPYPLIGLTGLLVFSTGLALRGAVARR